ncbi:helix-turn-helix domain-containing protein [Teredinibacter turnerae]|uniref:helix-turn-helix domain-containing protein n=1 Tax=Teredinibacter turnerae TaxID=2426 RepID=UPI000374118B|nr:helix-turn-helix transcriptional regulator [Teredinibacter turnerae]
MNIHPNLITLLLVTSTLTLLFNLTAKNKQAVHWLFALFAGSVLCMAITWGYGKQMGRYEHLLNMAACMTCNGYWLVARALFRGPGGVRIPHVLLAVSAALCMMGLEFLQFFQADAAENAFWLAPSMAAMGSWLNLLSPCFLLLALWEGCRNYQQQTTQGQMQRTLFVSCFALALIITTTVVNAIQAAGGPNLDRTMSTIAATAILLITQVLIFWRVNLGENAAHCQAGAIDTIDCTSETDENGQHTNRARAPLEEEKALAKALETTVRAEQLHLTSNLKLVDVAQRLNTSEYRISRAIRNTGLAPNFNQWVNAIRIEHAKALLDSPSAQALPLLTIALESGFSSPSTFNRAFKLAFDCTPGEYRQQREKFAGC